MCKERSIKVADPVPSLPRLALYYGLEKVARPAQIEASVWVAILERAGIDGEKLPAAALELAALE